MATKTIKFRTSTDGTTSTTDGANGILLATAGTGGVYPTTFSGSTAGWTPDNNASIGASTTTGTGIFSGYTVNVPVGTARRLRIDRAAGTFTIKLQTYLPDPTYASTAIKVIQADGTTVAYAQNGGTVVDRNSDTIGNRQINTNGSLQTVGTADAGQSITTTGAFFYIEWGATGSYATRLTYIEFDDGVTGGGSPAALFRRRYS